MRNAIEGAQQLLTLVADAGLAVSSERLAQVSAVELSFRALLLLALERLRSVQHQYPATLQAFLVEPERASVLEDDAGVDAADFLGCLDLLDLISEPDLPCISPRLHRGWQDRVRSCHAARLVSREALDFYLTEPERRALMRALAVCNRVFRVPPPVALDTITVQDCLTPVLGLVERLAPESEAEAIFALCQRLRGAHATPG